MNNQDVIIIGAGMSALVAANTLADQMNVKIYTKKLKSNGNSWRAQGGMAVAIHEEDTPFEHISDTLEAGCFHNDREAVSLLVKEGLKRVKKWIEAGMTFDTDSFGNKVLGMEGAHGKRRILHAGGDQTGAHLMTFLNQRVATASNIEIYENEQVIDLIVETGTCKGIIYKDMDGKLHEHRANYTILAAGGCGGIFEATSNDPSIIGDGIAMAYRAGAALSDMEFLQFHPTVIVQDGKVIGLASEAIRGEGARLIDAEGYEIMKGIHPLRDLAPRDIVARIIERYIHNGKEVFLDISSIKNFKERFPAIHKMCKDANISLENQRIPVAPGAHFLMGGAITDSSGKTTLPGLYAVGEVARTGVHGANRLASNSLLEALVFGERAAENIINELKVTPLHLNYRDRDSRPKKDKIDMTEPHLPSRIEIKHRVSLSLGVQRDLSQLLNLYNWLNELCIVDLVQAERSGWSLETIEKSNMLITAWLMTRSALERRESRGAHYRTDYPVPDAANWQGKQIIRKIQQNNLVFNNQWRCQKNNEQVFT